MRSAVDPHEYKLTIGGVVVPVMSGRLIREFNSLGDSWTGEVDWVPGQDSNLDKILKPYKYPDCTLHLGGTLVATGALYGLKNKISATGGVTVELHCYTKTVDLIDSTFKPGDSMWYEQASMAKICQDVLASRNYQFQVNGSGSFQAAYIEADKTESIANFLIRLAQQRGMLMTNDEYGKIIFRKATATGRSVGLIQATDTYGTEWEAEYDGRKRFAEYWGIGQSGDADDVYTHATDQGIPSNRVQSYVVEDSATGEMSNAVAWKRSRQLADALKIPYPVSDWYAPDGTLWAPNTLVTIQSPAIHCASGFDFLIKKAEHIFEAGGCRANLELVPPQVYTGEQIREPWAQSAPPRGRQQVAI